MSTATTIRTALEAVPAEVSAYIDKAIPTMQVPSIPTDEASSLLACGYAAYNECLILKEFEGWKPLHTLLRLGQRSNASIASILLGLKYDESNYIYTGASEWQESFRISGDTGNLGALNNRERVALAYLESLETWRTALKAWFDDTEMRIQACEEAYASGAEIPYTTCSDLPVPLPLPVPRDPTLPSPEFDWFFFIRFLVEVVLPAARRIAEEIIKRINKGGSSEPFTKLFKKFAFLRKDDVSQGFSDLTSILLLNADKPLEIINSLGQYDVFLDTTIDEGEGETP